MNTRATVNPHRAACLVVACIISVVVMILLAPGAGRPLAYSPTAGAEALACPDQDADGYAACAADCDSTGLVCGDCNDADPDLHPDAAEICNHVDDDCNGRTDDGFPAVAGSQKITNPREGAGDQFGSAVAAIGDVTGDGVADFAVSALNPLEASILSGADRSVVCRMSDPAAFSRFGAALAGIGDVTGDGVPDVAVGEPNWNSGSVPYVGVVGIFSGADCSLVRNCHASGCSPATCGDNLGVSLAALGDVTGDGVPDLVAGAPSFSNGLSNGNSIGRAIVFSGADCQVAAALQASVPVQNSRFGTTVAGVGDLDRDGVQDFAVGTFNTVQSYIFSGASRTLIRTLVESTSLLRSFAALPDLDGDGVSEFAAGAPFYDASTGSLAGSVVIYSGASGVRLRRCADPSGMSGDSLGSAVTNMGDMTGDGVPEIAAAAPGWDAPGVADAGGIVLFSSSDCTMVGRLTDSVASPGEQLGSGGVARVGDLNADGVAEVAAGAGLDDTGGRTDSGSVLIFSLQSDCDGDGSIPFGGDCADGDPTRHPGIDDICDQVDNDCDGFVDESADGDPSGVCDDCNDRDPRVFPGNLEVCDGLDNNCNGIADEGTDIDGDGFTTPCDCNDADATIHPGAAEVCNQADDDCDGQVDEGMDVDGDGASTPCDCNDVDATVRPGAPEQCNLVDDDCDGLVDEEHPLYQTVHRQADPTGTAGDQFGSAVAGLGDVTGDGVPDYAVSAPRDDTAQGVDAGSALVISGRDRSPVCRLFDPTGQAGDGLGKSLAAVGDITGDAVPDIAVGIWGYDKPGEQESGSVVLFSGRDCSIVRRCVDPGFSYASQLGFSVAGLPDVDGDGMPDLVAGSPGRDGGQALVFSGGDCSLIRRLAAPGGSASSNLGWSVTGLGDVTGDGIADIAAGDIRADTQAGTQSGRVLVFSGADGTLVRTLTDPAGGSFASFGLSLADLGDLDGDGVTDLLVGKSADALAFSGHDGSLLRRCPATSPGVARLEDITGDGLPEIVAGDTQFAMPSRSSVGRITVRSGADCSLIASLTDPLGQAQDFLGLSVAVVGDLDRDGFPEIVGGVLAHDTLAGQDAGQALLFGVEGDCDADGYTRSAGDCDDANPAVNPGAREICDGIDNDCDGVVDGTGSGDADSDGIPDCADNCPSIPNPGQDPEACLQRIVDITIDFKSPLGKGAGSVAWRTTHEVDLLGFNVVVIGPQGERTQLNSVQIPCEACISGEGLTYAFSIPKHKSGRDIFIEAVRRNAPGETYGPARRL